MRIQFISLTVNKWELRPPGRLDYQRLHALTPTSCEAGQISEERDVEQ